MRRSILLPLLLGLSLSTAAPAGDGHDGRRHAHQGHALHALLKAELKALNLSDAQKQTVRALLQREREHFRSAHERLHAARQAFNSAEPGTTAYEQAAATLAEVQAAAARERVSRHAAFRNELYALLDGEQKAAYLEQLRERQGRFERRRLKHARDAEAPVQP